MKLEKKQHTVLFDTKLIAEMQKPILLTESRTPERVLENYNNLCNNHDLTSKSLLYTHEILQRKIKINAYIIFV